MEWVRREMEVLWELLQTGGTYNKNTQTVPRLLKLMPAKLTKIRSMKTFLQTYSVRRELLISQPTILKSRKLHLDHLLTGLPKGAMLR
jgi:hypothetical protein